MNMRVQLMVLMVLVALEKWSRARITRHQIGA
jgi:hypothetical protein